jgi:hypothetical protein
LILLRIEAQLDPSEIEFEAEKQLAMGEARWVGKSRMDQIESEGAMNGFRTGTAK